MQHILCRSEVVSAGRLQELRQRYPQLIRSTEKLYPAEEGNIYYEPQLRVKNGAAVHCPYKGCGHLLRYRDLRIVTRRIDAHSREVYFLERCCCPHCRKQGRQSYHMLYPEELTAQFRYSMTTVGTAIRSYLFNPSEKNTSRVLEKIDPTSHHRNDSTQNLQTIFTEGNDNLHALDCLDDIDEKTVRRWYCWFVHFSKEACHVPVAVAPAIGNPCPSQPYDISISNVLHDISSADAAKPWSHKSCEGGAGDEQAAEGQDTAVDVAGTQDTRAAQTSRRVLRF